jgi:hypothetical protein
LVWRAVLFCGFCCFGLQSKSDLIEEETVMQNQGSLFWVGFLVWGLMQSMVGFWVSSSSMVVCIKFNS